MVTSFPQFSVVVPTDDITLLTAEEQRVAAGLDRTDTSQDEALSEYEAEVAAEIAEDCAITSDGVNPPTLRSEQCTDVFRLTRSAAALFLSRRHVSAVATVTEDGIVLIAGADWRIAAEAGKVIRMIDDADACWSGQKVQIDYTAGFTVVPNELKAEAKARIKLKASEGSRDPLARSIRTDIPDIESRQIDYQLGGLSRLTGDGLSSESERRLRRFMTQSMVG